MSLEEIKARCRTCAVTNPLACKDVCDFWKLRQQYVTLTKDLPEKPDPTTIISAAIDENSLRILRLIETENGDKGKIRIRLGDEGTTKSVEHSLELLMRAGLARVEGDVFHITTAGRKTLESLAEIPSRGLEKMDLSQEKVLRLIHDGLTTVDELGRDIPRAELNRTLEQLQVRGVVEKVRGRKVLYYATKRRPTRRLAPTELTIFKNLPKNGASPQDLSRKLDLTLPRVYRYLRLLRYKRHAVRRKQGMTFALTPIGAQIAEALARVEKTVRDLSPSDFA